NIWIASFRLRAESLTLGLFEAENFPFLIEIYWHRRCSDWRVFNHFSMKKIVGCLAVLLALLGCSKEPAAKERTSLPQSAPDGPRPIDPSKIVLVQTAERKERLAIKAEAAAYLAAKEYSKLEALAAKWRKSKA